MNVHTYVDTFTYIHTYTYIYIYTYCFWISGLTRAKQIARVGAPFVVNLEAILDSSWGLSCR